MKATVFFGQRENLNQPWPNVDFDNVMGALESELDKKKFDLTTKEALDPIFLDELFGMTSPHGNYDIRYRIPIETNVVKVFSDSDRQPNSPGFNAKNVLKSES